jgi:hypothetical protein
VNRFVHFCAEPEVTDIGAACISFYGAGLVCDEGLCSEYDNIDKAKSEISTL